MNNTDNNMLYLSDFKERFRPTTKVNAVYKFTIERRKKALIVEIEGSQLNCYYGNCEKPQVTCKVSMEVMNQIVTGQMSFVKAFMTGDMQIKGDFKMLRILDESFDFSDEEGVKNSMKRHFEGIVGYQEIIDELVIIIDSLRNRSSYEKMGANVDNAVLIFGEPGSGKTALASSFMKATGRCSFVCRKNTTGGSFIDEIIDAFSDAIKYAPSVILLDDLDNYSDNDDRELAEEYTIIQSLMEQVRDKDVFVVATATDIRKMPDSLLAPERLGNILETRSPNKEEARELISYYLTNSGLTFEVDMEDLVKMFLGKSCYFYKAVINKAIKNALFVRKKRIEMSDIVSAYLKVDYRAKEICPDILKHDVEKTAYHEAGHALVSELLDPGSVGLLSIYQEDDSISGAIRYCRSGRRDDYSELDNYMKISVAGKAAVDLVYGEPLCGNYVDLRNAYNRASDMIEELCFCGFRDWISSEYGGPNDVNKDTIIATIINKNYQDAKKIIAGNRPLLDALASELMEKTVLISSDIQNIFRTNTDELVEGFV